MSQTLPLDARVRELWKAVAISAAEIDSPEVCIDTADKITLAFLERFYPAADTASDRGYREVSLPSELKEMLKQNIQED